MQLEDVLSWQCGHPQVRSMQSSAGKDATEAAGGGDLQLDVLSNLERHVDRLSAFSDEEDEAELHNLYMVSVRRSFWFSLVHSGSLAAGSRGLKLRLEAPQKSPSCLLRSGAWAWAERWSHVVGSSVNLSVGAQWVWPSCFGVGPADCQPVLIPHPSQCSVLPSLLPMRPSSLQDQNSEGDLWDLAIIEGGDAVRRPASSSPFASKALLTCFNSDVRSASNLPVCKSP